MPALASAAPSTRRPSIVQLEFRIGPSTSDQSCSVTTPQFVPGTGAKPDMTYSPVGDVERSAPLAPAVTSPTGKYALRSAPSRSSRSWKIDRPDPSTRYVNPSCPGATSSSSENMALTSGPWSDATPDTTPMNSPRATMGAAIRIDSRPVRESRNTPEVAGWRVAWAASNTSGMGNSGRSYSLGSRLDQRARRSGP